MARKKGFNFDTFLQERFLLSRERREITDWELFFYNWNPKISNTLGGGGGGEIFVYSQNLIALAGNVFPGYPPEFYTVGKSNTRKGLKIWIIINKDRTESTRGPDFPFYLIIS